MSGSARAGFTRRRVVATCGGAVALAVLAARAPARAQAGNVATLKIATVGAGREGGTLGKLFARRGHPVMFSSRHPEQLGDLVASAGPNASAGTVEQAIAFADVVLVVVPYSAMEQIGRDHGPALAGKRLIIDVSNPIASRDGEEFVRRVNAEGGPGLATAKWLGAQKVIRAFNAIGYARLEQEAERGGQAGIPIAGDDPEAVALASGLIRNLGFEPVLVGGLAFGRYLVPGTPLAGVHTPQEIRSLAEGLK
jgi:8-hydroxy-5-deazaflavin:NADPH oxidoreductase